MAVRLQYFVDHLPNRRSTDTDEASDEGDEQDVARVVDTNVHWSESFAETPQHPAAQSFRYARKSWVLMVPSAFQSATGSHWPRR